jgi:3-mercaptopyruvate sulfurtransferase SseA
MTDTNTPDVPSTSFAHLTLSDDEIGLRLDAVGIRNLCVLVTEEDPGVWVAQGLQIDYAAQGRSAAEVKQRFHDGLRATISDQMEQYHSITQLLVPAREEVFAEFRDAIKGPVYYSHLVLCVEPINETLSITYLTDPKAA